MPTMWITAKAMPMPRPTKPGPASEPVPNILTQALGDAARTSRLDLNRLAELLAPLAARNGFRKDDGEALLARLMKLAGLDAAATAKRIAADDELAALVSIDYLRRMTNRHDLDLEELVSDLRAIA